MESNILIFNKYNDNKLKEIIYSVFKDSLWVNPFLNDSHHGFNHWIQVKDWCLKLVERLNIEEKQKLLYEWKSISLLEPLIWAILSIKIASIFHDSWRFNDNWEIVAEEQKTHHILSFNRAKFFCVNSGIDGIIPYIEDAIINHDFQSEKLTPHLNSPKSIIWKIVQASDQMWWFHPDSIIRTINYNKSLWIPFYDLNINLEERLNWKPQGKSKDALTVILNQLFWPIWIDRFGIEAAREKIAKYKIELEAKIFEKAKENNLEKEVKVLIDEFKSKAT